MSDHKPFCHLNRSTNDEILTVIHDQDISMLKISIDVVEKIHDEFFNMIQTFKWNNTFAFNCMEVIFNCIGSSLIEYASWNWLFVTTVWFCECWMSSFWFLLKKYLVLFVFLEKVDCCSPNIPIVFKRVSSSSIDDDRYSLRFFDYSRSCLLFRSRASMLTKWSFRSENCEDVTHWIWMSRIQTHTRIFGLREEKRIVNVWL